MVYVSMDVRTRDEGQITFKLEKDKEQIKLILNKENDSSVKFVCVKSVSTSIKNLEPGTYEMLVLNSQGNHLLATRKFNVK